MNGEEIQSLAMKHPEVSKHFIGVFSSNTLPEPASVGFYVANLDPDTKEGTHWVAMDITGGKDGNIYFDSYGLPPCGDAFLKCLGKNFIYNSKRLQHMLSTTCGQWCLYFLLRRAHKWSLDEIVEPFQDQGMDHSRSIVNDHVLNYKVEQLFNTDLDVIDRAFAVEQITQILRQINPAEESLTRKK